MIATGKSHSFRELMAVAFEHVGPRPEAVHQPRSALRRPAEVALLVGDASKARGRLGWVPRMSFEELVRHMVDADLAALAAEHRV